MIEHLLGVQEAMGSHPINTQTQDLPKPDVVTRSYNRNI